MGGGPIYLAPKFFSMEIIFVLIAISLVVAGGFLAAFFWAVKAGQYDDDYTPAIRILFDDKPVTEEADKALDSESITDN